MSVRHNFEPEIMRSIQEFIEQYPGEWLAIDVAAEAEGQPKAGKLVYHAKDRDEVWRKTKSRRRLYIVFAGPALKEGYAAAF
jgi:hypothetical protein